MQKDTYMQGEIYKEISCSVFLSITYQKAPQNRSLKVLITKGMQQK